MLSWGENPANSPDGRGDVGTEGFLSVNDVSSGVKDGDEVGVGEETLEKTNAGERPAASARRVVFNVMVLFRGLLVSVVGASGIAVRNCGGLARGRSTGCGAHLLRMTGAVLRACSPGSNHAPDSRLKTAGWRELPRGLTSVKF